MSSERIVLKGPPAVDVRLFYDIIGLSGQEFTAILRGLRKVGEQVLAEKIEAKRCAFFETIAKQAAENLDRR